MRPINDENLELALAPLVDKLGEHHWTGGKGEAYGGAGVALAVVLVLLQIKLDDGWRVASLGFSALSIPLWIGVAQVCGSRESWGFNHANHPSLTKYVAYAAAVYFVASAMLFAAVTCLLASFNWPIALAFFCIGSAVSIAISKYTLKTQRILFNHLR